MPEQLWGTFSVADHLDTRALVADVLLYDRLIIPCPPPTDREYQRWCDRGWKPNTQARLLRKIDGLYEPVFWSEKQKANFEAFASKKPREQSLVSDIADRVRMELYSLQDSREWLREQSGFMLIDEANKLPEGEQAAAITILCAYRSCEAFNKEFAIDIIPPNFKPAASDRETEVYHVIGRKLTVPADDNPETSLERAVELAKSEDYIRHRKRLYEHIESRMNHVNTKRADRVVIDDAIEEINALARKTFKLCEKRLLLDVARLPLKHSKPFLVIQLE